MYYFVKLFANMRNSRYVFSHQTDIIKEFNHINIVLFEVCIQPEPQ